MRTERPTEEQIAALQKKIDESIGEERQTVLSQVLSCYPDKADLFIRTQNYARAVLSARPLQQVKPKLRFYLENPSGRAKDLEDHRIGDDNGYCARLLAEALMCIRSFRDPYRGEDEEQLYIKAASFKIGYGRVIDNMLYIQGRYTRNEQLSEDEEMVLQAIQTTRVTEEEITHMQLVVSQTFEEPDIFNSVQTFRLNNALNGTGWYVQNTSPSTSLQN